MLNILAHWSVVHYLIFKYDILFLAIILYVPLTGISSLWSHNSQSCLLIDFVNFW